MFDATDLSGIYAEPESRGICAVISKKVKNLCEVLSSSREGIMKKKPRKHVFWSLKRSEMRFLMKPSSPGDRLPEEQVGKMFNVSHSPVREVLLALEKEGTVVIEPYKGATVKPLSAEEAFGHRGT